MLVKDWVSGEVITVDKNTAIFAASNMMKKNKIRCLPVVDDKSRVIGMITDLDLKEASPSKATTLDVFELNYLLSKVKVDSVMTKDVITLKDDETLEFAAALMLENKISNLPVVDNDSRLIGIVSQSDMFKALIEITGVYAGGPQYAFSLEDRPGSIKEVVDVIRSFGGSLVSILARHGGGREETRDVYIRIKPMGKEKLLELSEALEKQFDLLYTVEDLREEIEKRSKRKKS